MKDGIIKVILKYLLLYLLILIILVGTIAIVITLSGVYLEIINYNLDLVGIINVSLITILVLITGAYGYFTWQIVDDQRKSRQIAEIDKKLEMFYQPLENLFEISTIRGYPKVIDKGVGLEPNAMTSFKENNTISYLYLACDEVKEFLQIIMTGLLPEDMDAKVFYQMYGDIEDIVTKKISELKDERTKLLG